ncbi:DNA gyrase subunit A [Microcystis aeruginosa NIES-2549]|uniref:DNA gyrase subunit A n=1 Tax=Microcystis aeruginosa NIES-2549 TaxID=1641812 RepID=A0A0F6U4Y7_MICAE|nr:DNA gyrase subunit A [Microcystis aeruginosa NIES-2549]AOC53116.1 DNA gyrase subunit A [Microcystis aeruginosa NIES-2481]
MKKFSPPQMKEVSFPTPHTLHPTPSFQSGGFETSLPDYDSV